MRFNIIKDLEIDDENSIIITNKNIDKYKQCKIVVIITSFSDTLDSVLKEQNIGNIYALVDGEYYKEALIHPLLANKEELQFHNLIKKILNQGDLRRTRNGEVYSIFGEKMEFDLSNGFPLMTTKRMFLRGVFEELKFFLSGKTDTNILKSKGVHIWDANTSQEFIDKIGLPYEEGDMGPMYGHQFRHYGADYISKDIDYTGKGYDQLEYVINEIINNPTSRRIIMTSFNPFDAQHSVLYPCHSICIQFYVNDNKLSCSMTQRSCDIMCGFPFNLASTALLIHIMCAIVNNRKDGLNLIPGKLILFFNDIHLYKEHQEQALEQIKREPYNFPILNITKKVKNSDELEWKDIELKNYNCHPAIKTVMIA